MSASLKGYKFEHTELSVHFESFNNECAIVREAHDANLLSQESKRTHVITCSCIGVLPNRPPLSYNGCFFNTLK